jgi:hypothetical protein
MLFSRCQANGALAVKDVRSTDADARERRWVVCHNEEQAQKDRADREPIVVALKDQLRRGANRGISKLVLLCLTPDSRCQYTRPPVE